MRGKVAPSGWEVAPGVGRPIFGVGSAGVGRAVQGAWGVAAVVRGILRGVGGLVPEPGVGGLFCGVWSTRTGTWCGGALTRRWRSRAGTWSRGALTGSWRTTGTLFRGTLTGFWRTRNGAWCRGTRSWPWRTRIGFGGMWQGLGSAGLGGSRSPKEVPGIRLDRKQATKDKIGAGRKGLGRKATNLLGMKGTPLRPMSRVCRIARIFQVGRIIE